jgi:beta-glucosidase-like glycosyl hydrolase
VEEEEEEVEEVVEEEKGEGGGNQCDRLVTVKAINQGKITEAKAREAVSPMFYTRMRLGEFDPPEINPYSKFTSADADTPQHKALALEAAMKTFVLLKNSAGFLPLNQTIYNSIGVSNACTPRIGL